MQGVEVVLDDSVTLHLAGAWVDDQGDGEGTEARAEVAGPPPLEITGARSNWNLKAKTVVFEGEVRATRGPVVLECAKLEVSFRDERVQEATATGSVRVTRGARVATSSAAHLTADDGRLVLEGGVALVEGESRMTGAKMTLYLDDERVECSPCRLVVAGEAIAPLDPR